MGFAIRFISTMIFFLFLDLVWLGVVAKNLYSVEYGNLMRRGVDGMLDPHLPAALVVYILFALGILLFVVRNAEGQWLLGLGWGALFGLVVYGVFDFTNLAVLANWSTKISVIDTLWGTTICALTGAFATMVDKMLN